MAKYVENEIIESEIHIRLKNNRELVKINQEKMAEHLGVSKRTYQKLEAKPYLMTYNQINKYVDFVNEKLIALDKKPLSIVDIIVTDDNKSFYSDYNLEFLTGIIENLQKLEEKYNLTDMRVFEKNETKAVTYLLQSPELNKYLKVLWDKIELALKVKDKTSEAYYNAQKKINKKGENADVLNALKNGITEQYAEYEKKLNSELYSIQNDFVKGLVKSILITKKPTDK